MTLKKGKEMGIRQDNVIFQAVHEVHKFENHCHSVLSMKVTKKIKKELLIFIALDA